MWFVLAVLVWVSMVLAVYFYLEVYGVYLRWKRGKE